MKSIRDHLTFILPLMAILLGIEFFLAFDRVTANYEEQMRSDYSILVVSQQPLEAEALRRIDGRISGLSAIAKDQIARRIAKGMQTADASAILKELPYFYRVHLSRYLDTATLERIGAELKKVPGVLRVETFGERHRSQYNLYRFLKVVFWSFATLMGLVSLFLIVKQMEVWQMAHRERMQIMEIFGAPMMLRSGVLFRIAVTDALLATIFSAGLFALLRFWWAPRSGIDLLQERGKMLFAYTDTAILAVVALAIVILAVFSVALSSREVRE